jgi:phosphatidate phosphatase APP1
MTAGSWLQLVEQAWDSTRLRRRQGRTPRSFRIDAYLGHGSREGVVVRGRVVDDPAPAEATEGESVRAVLRRTLSVFLTDDLPGVPLEVRLGSTTRTTTTDSDGYFLCHLPAPDDLVSPWTRGEVGLAGTYRGLEGRYTTPLDVRVPAEGAEFGILSDIDDTILETGVQRVGRMVLQTITGSALTRTPLPGAAALYRDLAREVNPVFYVSSSPWNLHAFLLQFLRHRDFPLGPVLLRDLLGGPAGREPKATRIREVLRTHPHLRFVLVGDSGEEDPQVYAEVVREHPGRIIAVYIREVRLDPGDGRVERVSDSWDSDVPFVLAADSDAVRRHARSLGLL